MFRLFFSESSFVNPLSLDVKRALTIYLDRTKHFRSTQALFVSAGSGNKGKKASLQTISRWIKHAIFQSYKSLDVLLPVVSSGH